MSRRKQARPSRATLEDELVQAALRISPRLANFAAATSRKSQQKRRVPAGRPGARRPRREGPSHRGNHPQRPSLRGRRAAPCTALRAAVHYIVQVRSCKQVWPYREVACYVLLTPRSIPLT
jgi:hypothetical protein